MGLVPSRLGRRMSNGLIEIWHGSLILNYCLLPLSCPVRRIPILVDDDQDSSKERKCHPEQERDPHSLETRGVKSRPGMNTLHTKG